MTAQSFDIYAPLHGFHWDGDCFELSPGLWIKRFAQTPDLQGLDATLSSAEQDKLFFAKYWLTFRWVENAEPSPKEILNLVLLSLWLVKPTKVRIAFCFNLGLNAVTDGSGSSRLLDRFSWVPGETYEQFELPDLQSAVVRYRAIDTMNRRRGRLNNALILTLSGCWSHFWQVALICYAAAAETLLTCSTEPGITRRLSTVFACLVESQPYGRDVAFQKFWSLYSIRSDIMHGRTHNLPATDRLPTLVQFAELIRKLWGVVISSPQLMAALEGTDAQREAYFDTVCSGYSPPRPGKS